MVGKVSPQSVERAGSKNQVQLMIEGGVGFKKEGEST